MNKIATELPEKIDDGQNQSERLVSLGFLAQELSTSQRELRRNIPSWPGFPPAIDMGYRTKRYSYRSFQIWLKDFIKQKTSEPKATS